MLIDFIWFVLATFHVILHYCLSTNDGRRWAVVFSRR